MGEGSYGQVAQGRCTISGETVAIKYVKDLGDCEYDWVKVTREIQIMEEFSKMERNQFTVKLLDLFVIQENKESMGLFIVMEHMDSDLKKVLNNSSEMELTETHVTALMYNLICALKFVHSADVMHRDLKPANILVNNDCEVKICDFGLARTLPESLVGKGSGNSKRTRDYIMQGKLLETSGIDFCNTAIALKLTKRREEFAKKPRSLSNHIGSRWYRAPEVSLLEKQYDFAQDNWSLGCILYELLKCSTNNSDKTSVSLSNRALF